MRALQPPSPALTNRGGHLFRNEPQLARRVSVWVPSGPHRGPRAAVCACPSDPAALRPAAIQPWVPRLLTERVSQKSPSLPVPRPEQHSAGQGRPPLGAPPHASPSLGWRPPGSCCSAFLRCAVPQSLSTEGPRPTGFYKSGSCDGAFKNIPMGEAEGGLGVPEGKEGPTCLCGCLCSPPVLHGGTGQRPVLSLQRKELTSHEPHPGTPSTHSGWSAVCSGRGIAGQRAPGALGDPVWSSHGHLETSVACGFVCILPRCLPPPSFRGKLFHGKSP